MSDSIETNGSLWSDPNRPANEALGRRLSQLLHSEGILTSLEGRLPDEPWQLGRLLRAFVGVEDPRIRAEIISLLEAIGLLKTENHSAP